MLTIVLIIAIPFAFIFISKITMPHSKKMLKWLNKLSNTKLFQSILIASLIVLSSIVLIGIQLLSSARMALNSIELLKEIVLGLVGGVVMGIVVGGILLSVMRYSYEYIVEDHED